MSALASIGRAESAGAPAFDVARIQRDFPALLKEFIFVL